MRISPTEREVLFGTPFIARQIQKFVEAKGEVGLDSVADVFSELPRRVVRNYLLQLCRRGAMRKEEGVYIATEDYVGIGVKSDNAWRAARLLSTFDPPSLAKVAEVDPEHAATLCRVWLREKHVVLIGRRGKMPIYRLISKEVVRPIIYQSRRSK